VFLTVSGLVILVQISLAGVPLLGPSFVLDQMETEESRLIYFDPHQTHLTPYVGRSFHNSLEFQKEFFEWTPWEPTLILLKDFSDYGNAAARSAPNNALFIDIAPLARTYETFTAGERIYTLMNHELVHVATMDVWNKRDARWRNFFFGKPSPLEAHPESILYNYLTTPRVNVPRWYLEGSAVFMETWMAGGLGRAKGAYDEMVFRSMVRDDAHFYSALGLVSEGTRVDFQVGVNAYLYGTRFMSYMALAEGPESVIEWLKRGEGSEPYYANQFKKVYGKSLTSAWDEWIHWEKEFQAINLKSVNRFPITQTAPLSKKPLGSVSRSFINPENGKLIGAFNFPGAVSHLGELDPATGKIRKLSEIKGPMLYEVTSLAYDPATNRAWYTADNYAFRDLVEVDVTTGRKKTVLKDQRVGDLAFNRADGSLWGLRHRNSYVSVVRTRAPYERWESLYAWPYTKVPYDIDVSPDGKLFSMSQAEVDGNQSIRIYTTEGLVNGELDLVAEFNFGTTVPEAFVFSDDGKYLYGSSYYTGVSNIFRYEWAINEMEAVSNAETGLFRPIPISSGGLVAYEYTGGGFMPIEFAPEPTDDLSNVNFLGEKVQLLHPVTKTWGVGSPKDIDYEALVTERGKYHPFQELGLGSAYPIVEGYKGYGAVGWHFNIEDPIQFHKLQVTASYSPSTSLEAEERFHAYLGYQTTNWTVEYAHNGADFYDLFGPIERSRKGDAVQISYHNSLIYDTPRHLDLDVVAGFYTGFETLPNNQNVASGADEIVSASATLAYKNTRSSIGSVTHEKGYKWRTTLSAVHAEEETYTKFNGGFDFGFPLPLDHTSVWLYTSVGLSEGEETSSFSNYYFGGFGNNYVDDGTIKRYRQYRSLPGFEIDEVAAKDFGKTTLELNLPPLRFREVGAPSLYLSWARPALFASALLADPSDPMERTYYSAGAQMDFHFTLAHRLPMTLSVGYAAGFEEGDKVGDEAMISLKIL
jgi:hypothetical protein